LPEFSQFLRILLAGAALGAQRLLRKEIAGPNVPKGVNIS